MVKNRAVKGMVDNIETAHKDCISRVECNCHFYLNFVSIFFIFKIVTTPFFLFIGVNSVPEQPDVHNPEAHDHDHGQDNHDHGHDSHDHGHGHSHGGHHHHHRIPGLSFGSPNVPHREEVVQPAVDPNLVLNQAIPSADPYTDLTLENPHADSHLANSILDPNAAEPNTDSHQAIAEPAPVTDPTLANHGHDHQDNPVTETDPYQANPIEEASQVVNPDAVPELENIPLETVTSDVSTESASENVENSSEIVEMVGGGGSCRVRGFHKKVVGIS